MSSVSGRGIQAGRRGRTAPGGHDVESYRPPSGRVGAAHQGGVPGALLRAVLRSRVRGGGAGTGAGVRDGVGRLQRPYRKSPRTSRPAPASPTRRWRCRWSGSRTRAAIAAAEARQKDPATPDAHPARQRLDAQRAHLPGRDLEDAAAGRSTRARSIEALPGHEVDLLDVSTLADEPLKVIYPCKACVSTAQPLCHWPCSCYPNHALGQTDDWMDGDLSALGRRARRVHRCARCTGIRRRRA